MSIKRLQEQYDLLSELIHQLKMAHIIETNPAEKFRLEQVIKEKTALQDQLVQSLSGADLPEVISPFRGLEKFRPQDVPFFFGREEYTAKLIEKVRQQRLTLVMGASGSGKSSVVFAGLLPALQQEKEWLIVDCRPKSDPFYQLAARLAPLRLSDEASKTERDREINAQTDYFQESNARLFVTIDDILNEHPDAEQMVLVIDQFEELYTNTPDGDQQQFLELLIGALRHTDTPLKVVLTLRADFMAEVLNYRPLADLLATNHDLKLGPMNRAELQRIIEEPLAALNLQQPSAIPFQLAPGLGERILHDLSPEAATFKLTEQSLNKLGEKALSVDILDKLKALENQEYSSEEIFVKALEDSIGIDQTVRYKSLILKLAETIQHGNLPLVEFALSQLWKRQANRTLSHEAYDAIDGVRGALAKYAEAIFKAFTDNQQDQVQQIFLRLVQVGAEATRRVATRT